MTKVTNIEIKTASNGNPYKTIHISPTFKEKDRANIFSDHAMYNDLVEGYEIPENFLTINAKGYLEIVNPNAGIKRGGNSAGIAKAQEQKAIYIKEAQTNKENSIKLAGAARDAVLIVTAFYPELAEDDNKDEKIAAKIEEWRTHLLKTFDNPGF